MVSSVDGDNGVAVVGSVASSVDVGAFPLLVVGCGLDWLVDLTVVGARG